MSKGKKNKADWYKLRRSTVLSPNSVLELAEGLGTPSPVIEDIKVWEIRPKTVSSTFSESQKAASMHTDSQYSRRPEDFFLLHCVRPAKCGGGKSLLLDSKTSIEQLRITSNWAYQILRTTEVPFCSPKTFGVHGINFGKVIFGENQMRWRYDTLRAGLSQFPNSEALEAVEVFNEIIESLPKIELKLDEGETLVVDNSRMLHGRTAYEDPERLLLRVRGYYRHE